MTTCSIMGLTDTSGKQAQSEVAAGASATVLTSNGTGSLPSFQSAVGAMTVAVQIFTSTGTYTPTTNMQYCIIEVVGSGGGGGGTGATSASNMCCSGGGGSGSYGYGVFSAATIGGSQPVTIGTAGGGGIGLNASGGTGNVCSVGTAGAIISANGGVGGAGAATAANGSTSGGLGGAAGSGGSLNIAGNPGGSASWYYTGGYSLTGFGAPSHFGAGGASQAIYNGSAASTGQNAGLVYGSGGSGVGAGASVGAGTGGAGSKGVVIITEFIGATPSTGTQQVASGGTGLSSAAAYSLICGGTTTTGAFQTVADVATGSVLVSGGTAALPSFSATPTVTSISFGGSALGTYTTGGTFTPIMAFGGASSGVTYTAHTGTYTRVGNVVTFQLDVELSSKGSSTGTATITGLPFAVAATTIYAVSADHVTTTSGTISARSTAGATTINLDNIVSGGARALLDNTAFTNTSFVQISGSYLV